MAKKERSKRTKHKWRMKIVWGKPLTNRFQEVRLFRLGRDRSRRMLCLRIRWLKIPISALSLINRKMILILLWKWRKWSNKNANLRKKSKRRKLISKRIWEELWNKLCKQVYIKERWRWTHHDSKPNLYWNGWIQILHSRWETSRNARACRVMKPKITFKSAKM